MGDVGALGAAGFLLKGPHGIPLIRHAELGEAQEVMDFLRSRGA